MAIKPEAAPEATKVRVLIAFGGHLPNHVVTVPTAAVKALKDDGFVDDDGAAVTYAEEHEPQPTPLTQV